MMLAELHPGTRVVLIAFNDSLRLYGRGDAPEYLSSSLYNSDKLLAEGAGILLESISPLSVQRSILSDHVFALHQSGGTALGPALAVAIGIASQRQQSEIIIATDGMSNVGVGRTERLDTPQLREFYQMMGNKAAAAGTTISILGIEGADCGVATLGAAAETTNGTINVIKPLELQRQMRFILDNPVVAHSANVRVLLPSLAGCPVVFQNEAITDRNGTLATLNVGNITESCDTTFEFGVKPGDTQAAKADQAYQTFSAAGGMPIQLQMSFRKPTGEQAVRVVTIRLPVTKDRAAAEQNANVSVIALHAVKLGANLALSGQYGEARKMLLATQRMLDRVAISEVQMEEASAFVSRVEDLDTELGNLLKGSRKNDNSTRVFMLNKNELKANFLAGRRKQALVLTRKKHTASAAAAAAAAASSSSSPAASAPADNIQSLQQELAKKEEEKLCTICMQRPKDIVLVPCGHQIMCAVCSEEHSTRGETTCPICRATISQRIKTFGS